MSLEQAQLGVPPGISRNHASVACGQFLRKLWTFFDEQEFFLVVFTHQWPQVSNIDPQLICFCLKTSYALEKIAT